MKLPRRWLSWNFYRRIPWQKPSDAVRTRIIATAEFSSRSNLLGGAAAAASAAAAHLLRSNNFHSTICLILPHSFSPQASNLCEIKKTVLSVTEDRSTRDYGCHKPSYIENYIIKNIDNIFFFEKIKINFFMSKTIVFQRTLDAICRV